MKLTKLDVLENIQFSVIFSALLIISLVGIYLVAEPSVSRAVSVQNQFTVTQEITAEISFTTVPSDITMASIPGLTGGAATGTAQVVVRTNNNTGYTMTITASGSPAMQGDTQGGNIDDYTPSAAYIPDFSHTVAANIGEFAYTVSASNTPDLAQKFFDNTSVCGQGSADTGGADTCWYGLSTTATSTINRTSETVGNGATTTFFFTTLINSNPAPAIPEDFYTATATLTATTN